MKVVPESRPKSHRVTADFADKENPCYPRPSAVHNIRLSQAPNRFGFRISGTGVSKRAGEQGVALVITLIMLSVITFMAIAFLVLSRGERSSVTTAYDQSIARLAADNALERVQAELIAPMMISGDPSSFGLMVSTNYISQIGFQGGNAFQYILTSPTNVAYNYPNGGPLNLKDMLQNLTNLLISPRPPVFIVTNRTTGASDFRYYLDLNRNGMFDPSGWVRVTNGAGQWTGAFNFVQGDPQWIGGLEFPDRRHSPNNRFIYRYAYLVVPVSEGLDINYIHNAARRPEKAMIDANGSDYFRNQGVGTWEINLASFLYDLNTNTYAWGGRYVYRPDLATINGNAFIDACSILTRRYGGLDYPNRLDSVRNLFFNGPRAFADHSLDGYTAGPLMTTAHGYSYNPDSTPTPRSPLPWPGSDNTNHFYSTQDLFDPAKTSPNFAARLFATSTNIDTYDRYTFSRMLAQLVTDSAPEPPGKINLNYDNMVQRGPQGTVSETNFIAWRGGDFFTNAAAMLLTNAGYNLSLNKLQVYPTNFYTPSVHRLLQLAANIYDSTTNRTFAAVSPQYPYFPSVFRPIFRRDGTNVVIAGYREVVNANMAFARTAPLMVELDATNPAVNVFPQLGTPFDPNDKNEPMVSGIPLIIGAKKGFPNFNEFAMQTKILVTRLLEFKRAQTGGPVTQTNQMYVVGITNTFAVEAWNSYLTNYSRDLQLVTTVTMSATMTNETGVNNVLFNSRVARGTNMNIAANSWKGWTSGTGRYSMMLPFGAAQDFFFLNNSTYRASPPRFEPLTHEFDRTLASGAFYVPHWWLNLNTRLLFILVDTRANRIVDYVNIDNWERTIDINNKLAEGSAQLGGNPADYKNPANQWLTNRLGNSTSVNVPTYGVINQIQVGLNGAPDLQSFSLDPYAGLDAHRAVDGFRFNLMNLSPIYPDDVGKVFNKSNVFYAPFDPYRPIFIHTSWQANDPLVHYTAGDLKDLSVNPTNQVNFVGENPALNNIGEVNTRYRPWGGNPQNNDPLTDKQIAVKDPYVTRSDDWEFPTNKYPNIGWLGRVHRGTPWQTVFLKSTNAMMIGGRLDAGLVNWAKWTGNPVTIANPALSNMVSRTMITNLSKMIDPNSLGSNINIIVPDALFTSPTNDWQILDLFTTALNDNAGRGRLSINQTNLASWSAVLSGVSVLPNVSATNPPTFIQPAGAYSPANPPPLVTIVNALNNARTNFPNHSFTRLGDILSVPELTMSSPYLVSTNNAQVLNDAVIERIPQQVLGLLHGPEQPPRFVVYSYGQALRPAGPRSFFTGSGGYFGLCTNYQITAEVATRAVVRVDGAPSKPRTTIETFNVLPPD